MWPYLFGSGWIWDALLSAAVVSITIAGAAALLRKADHATGDSAAADDRLQLLWHRYEEGDVTRWEFERLTRPGGTQPDESLMTDAAAD